MESFIQVAFALDGALLILIGGQWRRVGRRGWVVVIDVDLGSLLLLVVSAGEDCAKDRANAVSQKAAKSSKGVNAQST